ncbi:OLC1v1006522C1 [Oldenlandia corymbosa var. corymbosa]|uniref:OLC1v1006522C1 n=1 Tax=Oldenlandia corymbosa var. corymbosa TaxID=529605 RepID=A0AAV1DHR1_OLDCO|nr:OLC1v1006522C1 [Oldenlandia corymbosa var. corymbosa]
MGGSRAFLIEVQALCIMTGSTTKQVNGVLPNKADMIIAVLNKQADLNLRLNGIYINVANGAKLFDTAGDVALAAASLNVPFPRGVAFIGEVGLGGDLRIVPKNGEEGSYPVQFGVQKVYCSRTSHQTIVEPGSYGP